MCDTKGVLYKGRQEGMNPYKERFAAETGTRSLTDALRGADVFFGLSTANCMTGDMVRSMAEGPIVFALANPYPEISYEEAKAARPDAIVATGRSDYPNFFLRHMPQCRDRRSIRRWPYVVENKTVRMESHLEARVLYRVWKGMLLCFDSIS